MNKYQLLKKSATGALWEGGSQIAGQLIHLAIRLTLARLLAPEEFGLMAMAMVVVNFTWWILDMGFGPALVQRKVLTEEHKSTAFWSNVFMGFAVCILLVFCSPIIAWFFHAEELTSVLVFLSFSVVLSSPESTLTALLQRDFGFKKIGVRKIASRFLGGITGITFAICGFGVWALVGDALVRSFSASLLLFLQAKWKPKFLFCRKAFSDLWTYSKHLVGSRFVNYFNRNLDTIIVGRFLGASSLGIYNLGYQFVLMPLSYVARSLNNVLFATLSKLQDDEENFRKAYLISLQFVGAIVFPLMTLMALSSKVLVPLFLGSKWQAAVPLIPLFCIVGTIQSFQSLMPAVLQAKGQTQIILRWQLISFIFNSLAFLIGINLGLVGVAICYTISTVIVTPILNRYVLRQVGATWVEFLLSLGMPFKGSFMVVVVWFFVLMIVKMLSFNIGSSMLTLLQIMVSSFCYVFLFLRRNDLLRRVRGKYIFGS